MPTPDINALLRALDRSSKQGAPMGQSDNAAGYDGSPVYVQPVRFVDDCYSADGTYWGLPADLWCAFTVDDTGSLELECYRRAPDRESAIRAFLADYPQLKVCQSLLADNYSGRFVDGYIECSLWSSHDNADESGGAPLDENYGPEDIAADALQKMQEDCTIFITANLADLMALPASATPEQCGHDFWLTRNGHGAGFWDRGYGAIGDRLTKACKACGSVDLTVGDDGKIYS